MNFIIEHGPFLFLLVAFLISVNTNRKMIKLNERLLEQNSELMGEKTYADIYRNRVSKD